MRANQLFPQLKQVDSDEEEAPKKKVIAKKVVAPAKRAAVEDSDDEPIVAKKVKKAAILISSDSESEATPATVSKVVAAKKVSPAKSKTARLSVAGNSKPTASGSGTSAGVFSIFNMKPRAVVPSVSKPATSKAVPSTPKKTKSTTSSPNKLMEFDCVAIYRNEDSPSFKKKKKGNDGPEMDVDSD